MSQYRAYDMMSYPEYLMSDHWKRIRWAALWRARHRCAACGREATEAELHVHHITRDRLGEEDPADVIVLCRDCHAAIEDHMIIGYAEPVKAADLVDDVVKEACTQCIPMAF